MLDRLDELVLKPVDGSGGYGLVIGPAATDEQLDACGAEVVAEPARLDRPGGRAALDLAHPHGSTAFAPRHVDLRPFAVNDGERVWVVPGGLTRVALPEGSLVVNSSQGGGSKDTWVLDAAPATRPSGSVAAGARQPGAVWSRPAAPEAAGRHGDGAPAAAAAAAATVEVRPC